MVTYTDYNEAYEFAFQLAERGFLGARIERVSKPTDPEFEFAVYLW